MKKGKYLFAAVALLLSLGIKAQQLIPVDQGSTVEFVISNLGFDVTGKLNGLKGAVLFDEKNLSASYFAVTVNAASIDTDNHTRDKHLRSSAYFYVIIYPQIRIQSVRMAKSVTPGYYVVFAKLTIKQTTKDISFPFTVTQEAGDYRFKGEFNISRRDFGVGGKNTISNDLKVKLNVLTKK
ncbi:MAG TPA: YceI family protein [Lacibacter sp.]|nr:YceI family protein [Lacibacter sp.]